MVQLLKEKKTENFTEPKLDLLKNPEGKGNVIGGLTGKFMHCFRANK